MEDISQVLDELVSKTNELNSLKDSIQFNKVTESDKQRIMSKVESLKNDLKEIESRSYNDPDLSIAINGAKDTIYIISNLLKL